MNTLTTSATVPPERPRLLVVDDQPINIQTLHQIFQADHSVQAATSAAQALALCQQQPLPDLILLDIVMPGMDGLSLCRQLKNDSLTADIPVIFVTAQSSSEEETAALEAGGVDFISKPVNPAVVRARVKTHLTLKAQGDVLRSLAFRDGLTGIANRRRFDEALEAAWRNAQRQSLPLGLVLMDIDHFKCYNDHYGHQQGDVCLQAIARTLEQQVQCPYDLVARYGGEEFVCLLPGSDLPGTLEKAEQLRQAVQALQLPHAQSPTAAYVSISLGAVSIQPSIASAADTPPQAWLTRADAALYQAKQQGRNRVLAG